MTNLSTKAAEWRKSSRSGKDTSCVEVRCDLDGLRDSKNVTGPTLRIDTTALVSAVKDGRLSR